MSHPLLRRTAASTAALLLTVLALSGCRTSPGVAAYVGDETISTDELEAAVEAGLAQEPVAELFAGQEADYRRRVLQDLIATAVYEAAAAKYDVSITPGEVEDRLAQIFLTEDEEQFYAAQAQQGVTEENVAEQVRRFVLGEKITEAAGLDEPLSDEALQDLYDEVSGASAQVRLGFIVVPDQATADAVLAQLEADPEGYAALAAQYPNESLPEITEVALTELPPELAEPFADTEPGQGFTLVPEQASGVAVGYVVDLTVPSFEELRPTLEQQASETVRTNLSEELTDVQQSLNIKVNPRYGSLDESGELVVDDRDVVAVIDDEAEPELQ